MGVGLLTVCKRNMLIMPKLNLRVGPDDLDDLIIACNNQASLITDPERKERYAELAAWLELRRVKRYGINGKA